MKYKCPKCGSIRIYQEISVYAKKNANTGRVYGVNMKVEDGDFTAYLYCDNCDHHDDWEKFECE